MIKVEIEPSKYGYLLLYPVSRKVARRIAKSNQYDHCAAVFLDDPEHFLKRLSSSQKRNLIMDGKSTFLWMNGNIAIW